MAGASLRRCWVAPMLYQDWQDEQGSRSSTWTELFYDLFVVAAISQTVKIFVDAPTPAGFTRYLQILLLFHFVWTSSTHLATRVRAAGLASDALVLIRHLGVLGMTLAAQDPEARRALFAGSYLLVRLVALLAFGAVWAAIPRARAYAAVSAAAYGTAGALAAAALGCSVASPPACSNGTHWALLWAALAIEAVAPAAVVAVPQAHLPLHVEHVDERLGLLQIIYLGESIVALGSAPLTNATKTEGGGERPVAQAAAVALGAVVVWGLFMSIYHWDADQHTHALRQSKARGLAFQYLHAALGVAINTAGAGLLMALGTESEGPGVLGPYKPHAAWTLCVSYGAALHLIAALRATHFLPLKRVRQLLGGKMASGGSLGRAAADKMLQGRSGAEKVKGHVRAWWMFAAVWPCVAYLLPLASGAGAHTAGGLSSTVGLLAGVALHALINVVVETGIAHTVAAKVAGSGEGSGGSSDAGSSSSVGSSSGPDTGGLSSRGSGAEVV